MRYDSLNLIHCSGSCVSKNYDEGRNSLFIMLAINTRSAKNSSDDNYNHDFPIFTVTGDKAKELNEKFKVGDFISVLAHADTQENLRPTGPRTYKKEWNTLFILDNVFVNPLRQAGNSATIAGKIIRVYRNPEAGHKFYLITVKIAGKNNEEDTRVSFACFDRNMQLEPKVGDSVVMSGIVQTKRMEADENTKAHTTMSLVARCVSIL